MGHLVHSAGGHLVHETGGHLISSRRLNLGPLRIGNAVDVFRGAATWAAAVAAWKARMGIWGSYGAYATSLGITRTTGTAYSLHSWVYAYNTSAFIGYVANNVSLSVSLFDAPASHVLRIYFNPNASSVNPGTWAQISVAPFVNGATGTGAFTAALSAPLTLTTYLWPVVVWHDINTEPAPALTPTGTLKEMRIAQAMTLW